MAPSGNTPIVILKQERIDSLVHQHKQVLGAGASCTVYLVEVGGQLCCLKLAKE